MGRGQGISYSSDGELCLKADEPQVGQRHEDVESKWKYYHIIIFTKLTNSMAYGIIQHSQGLSNPV